MSDCIIGRAIYIVKCTLLREERGNLQYHLKKYITGSIKQSKYCVVDHNQSSYLNWGSFVDCIQYLIAGIQGNV